MFKVGDCIRGISSNYNITDVNLILGKVISINTITNKMKVEIVYHKLYQKGYKGSAFEVENNKLHFEKIKYDYDKEMNEFGEYIINKYKTRKMLNKLISKSKDIMYVPTEAQLSTTYNDKYNFNRLTFYNIVKEDIMRYSKKLHLEEYMIEEICTNLYSKIFQFII